ncbi:unnamed protein product, partial [marine sediment metagenome]
MLPVAKVQQGHYAFSNSDDYISAPAGITTGGNLNYPCPAIAKAVAAYSPVARLDK